jgi:osmoprotectant transport system substrate-binding protein
MASMNRLLAPRRARRVVILLLLPVLGGCASSEPIVEDEREASVLATVEEASGARLNGPIPEQFDLDGAELWVGSPDPTEGDATDALLAAITVAALEGAGAEVVDAANLGGGLLVRDALISGEIDLYWEGIGDAWTAILRQPADGLDEVALHESLTTRDLTENGVAWLAPAAFDDGPRFAVSRASGADEESRVLSTLKEAIEDDETGNICVTSTFLTYPLDGRVAVEAALGVELPSAVVREYDQEPIYPETRNGTCSFGLVDASSGRVAEYDLVVLEDDLGAFLPNPPAAALREDVLVDHPEVAALVDGLADRLTPDVIRELNRQVVLEGHDVQTVARAWLVEDGLLPAP